MTILLLGDVAEVIAGQSPKGVYYNSVGDGVPFYQGKKDFGEKFIEKPSTWTTKVTKSARSGDILMSVRAPVGPINFATQDICIGRGLAAIRASSKIDKDFLFYFLLHKQPEISGNTGAVFDSINRDQIASMEVPVPPLVRQREIVENLHSAFAEIDVLEKRHRASIGLATILLENCIDDVFERSAEGDELLSDLASFENGDRGSNYPNKKMRVAEGIPFINAGHIDQGKINMKNMDFISEKTFKKLSRGKVQVNDLLFCLRGSLGKVALLEDLSEGAIASSLVIVRPKVDIDPRFILYYFLSSICKQEIEKTRSGTAQPNLGAADLKRFSVPRHSKEEMVEIVKKMEIISREVEALKGNYEIQSRNLLDLRKSLLSDAFTHQIAVA